MISWHPHPEAWALFLSLLAGYFYAIRRLGPQYRSPGEPAASRRQKTLFVLGILSMWIAAEWPIHELAERYLFSVHMTQHLLFSFVATPLAIAGIPDWMARRLLSPRWVSKVFRSLAKPLVAMALFNGYLVLTHWPVFVDFVTTSEPAHFLSHTLLVAVSMLMWWPVLSPLPELPRLSAPAQMLYLFGQTIIPTVPASFLTFADSAFYAVYRGAPRLIGWIDPVTDQRMAGLVMKLGGGTLLWAIIAVLFFRWSSKEETGTPDAIDWQDLEIKLNQRRPSPR